MVTVTSKEAIYIAAFFDGEGCIRPRFQPRIRQGKVVGRDCVGITFHISQKDRTILDWIRDTLGYGIVVEANRGTIHRFRITSRDEQARFIRAVHPHSRCKRQHLEFAYDLVKTVRSGKGGGKLPQRLRQERDRIAEEWLTYIAAN